MNLLYTLDELPTDATTRASWTESLRSWQEPDTGLFREASHDPIHTTAHCVAALECFDARLRAPLAALAPLRDPAAMERFLDALDWAGHPWTESHKGAGLYAALHLAGETTPEWESRYFAWLAREGDAETGLWRQGAVPLGEASLPLLFPHLAGTFHYLFNCVHAGAAPPHPAALAAICERIYAARVYPLARFVSFAEVDWVYCLHRAASTRCARCCALSRPSTSPSSTDSIPTRIPVSTICICSSARCRRSRSCRTQFRERSRASDRCSWCSTAARSSERRRQFERTGSRPRFGPSSALRPAEANPTPPEATAP